MAAMKERAKDRASPFFALPIHFSGDRRVLISGDYYSVLSSRRRGIAHAAAPGAKRQDLIASAKQFKNPLDFPKNHCEGVAYSCNYRPGIDYASMVLKDKAGCWLTLTRSGVDAGNAYS